MFFDEEMLLDLRLNILNEYVDKFVITESKFTHSGNIKNRNFDIKNFQKFENKIDYFYIEDEPKNIKKILSSDDIQKKNEKKNI
jgi:beta-1,4-mannosyl-glycoprotein beta-1,4-N-acetylglucosaminyltransferase